jgi:DNA-binding GntR family transcriptional regulator
MNGFARRSCAAKIRPNEPLIETELVDRLKASRTPIREGLARLASEGLLVSQARVWAVREHTPDEIRELYEIRAALEGMAARLAAERASDQEIAAIAAIHAEVAVEPLRQDKTYLVGNNDRFHTAILDAGNVRLAELVRQSREHFFNHRLAALYTD